MTFELDGDPNGVVLGDQGDMCLHLSQPVVYVKTGGNSKVGWVASSPGGTPGGSSGQVQFNSSGAFGGDPAFTYDSTTDVMALGNLDVTTLSADGFTVGGVSPGPASQTGAHGSPTTTPVLALTFTTVGHVVWCGATMEIDLPSAVGYGGRRFTAYNVGAFTITLDPSGVEVLVRDGVVQAGGLSIVLPSGAGNFVELLSDGARWITLGAKGTLTQGS